MLKLIFCKQGNIFPADDQIQKMPGVPSDNKKSKNIQMKKYLAYILAALFIFSIGCKSVARYPIDDPSTANLDDRILGRWKFEEDTNKNNFYEVIRRQPYAMDRYHVKLWDRGGTNPTYEANMHFSKIGDARFINVPYFEKGFTHMGFFFLKILEVNADFTKMTTATVHDTTLWELNQAGVKQRITRNVNNPSYYYDTVHFYKVQ